MPEMFPPSQFLPFSVAFTNFFPFAECLLSVLLFALSVGMVRGMNAIIRVLYITLISRPGAEPPASPRLAELDEQIGDIRRRMSALSPTDEFAQYFKLERLANKLEEERKKICVPSRKIVPAFSQKFALGMRAVALLISLALALHSSAETRLFTICADHFYPFNFLLDFPFSIAAFQWTNQTDDDVADLQQPVGLFSFSILSLFTWNCWRNARAAEKMSKKAA